MVFIYILQQQSNKYYVGKTENPKFRLDTHFKNGGCAWTKKYKPIQIIGLFPDCDAFDEDKYTIKYMKNEMLVCENSCDKTEGFNATHGENNVFLQNKCLV